MTQLHPRKKIELVVERARLPEMLDLLHEAGIRGYTVLPTLEGLGNRGLRGDDLTGVGGNVHVMAVTHEEAVHRLIELLEEVWGDAIGVLFVSDVQVLRPAKF